MNVSRKNKIAFVIISVLLVFLLIGNAFVIYAVVNSYDKVSKTNSFSPAELTVQIGENSSDPAVSQEQKLDWGSSVDTDGNVSTDKSVVITNKDSGESGTTAYMRVCLLPQWKETCDTTSSLVIASSQSRTSSSVKEATMEGFTFPESITGNNLEIECGAGKIICVLDANWATNWDYVYKASTGLGYFYTQKEVKSGDSVALMSSVSISRDYLNEQTAKGVKLNIEVLADSIQSRGDATDTKNWSSSSGATP